MTKKRIAKDFARSLDQPEIERVILYGSVARREDNKNSDIDILIVSQDKLRTKDKVAEQVSETLLNAGIYISAKVIPANEYRKLKDTHFISQIEKEGIVIGDRN